ncbi:Uncharacterised protein [Vibrio cholerae]|nr:Uncharacterised protein [Vibrio cholerae]CSB43199.1 Uncharacterised protein [Vibrio cholerae]CSC53615.1 Uncharacterised protein [Vibrio cholerae]CSI76277.1 Uncharacterised protein [Vibrio cholerae]
MTLIKRNDADMVTSNQVFIFLFIVENKSKNTIEFFEEISSFIAV